MANGTIALVGGESLLGREIRELAEAAGLELRLVAGDEDAEGSLTRLGDEPAVMAGLRAASLSGARAAILAGGPHSAKKALNLLGDPPESPVIDLTYTAEELPGARLRAPSVEDGEVSAHEADLHTVAHPAAIAMALFLRRLQRNDPLRRAVIQVFVPASEHGTAGVEELKEQTVALLTFKQMTQAVFGAQLGFNLLSGFGKEAPQTLELAELRIERHLATLLALEGEGVGAPMPSLRLVQAPVFHGYSFSAWVEFAEPPELEALEESLAGAGIEVRGEEFDPPTAVGQAGQSGISVGPIVPDRNSASACWFWFVADNLRLHAENAVAVARGIE